MKKIQYEMVFDELAKKYERDLVDEVPEEDGVEVDEDTLDEIPAGTCNLATIEMKNWSKLRISRNSFFGQNFWDWRSEGSPIYEDSTFFNWEERRIKWGISLLSEQNWPLLMFLKGVLFYCLPQNAVLQNIRSYNTTVAIGSQLMPLGRFLHREGIFIDQHGNGDYHRADSLSEDLFLDFMEEELHTPDAKYSFARQVENWQNLSKADLLPVCFQLPFEVIDKTILRKFCRVAEENKGTFQPIPVETLSKLVPHCMKIIMEHSDDILQAYDVVWPIIAGGEIVEKERFDWETALTTLEKQESIVVNLASFEDDRKSMSEKVFAKLKKAIREHPGWRTQPLRDQRLKRENAVLIAKDLDVNLYEVSKAIHYDVVKVKNNILTLASVLRNACVCIIMLVTGMRRSELLNLEAGKAWKVKGSDDDYRLEFFVFKTSTGSEGDWTVLPIPEIAFRAYELLERISMHARKYSGSNLLMVSPTSCFGKKIHPNSFNQFLERWCEALGIERIHPHQFRKTIAMFALYRDHRNLAIIRRLFSHKEFAMSLAYIVKLPGMSLEFKLAIMRSNKEQLAKLAEAIENRTIGGKAGQRILKQADAGRSFFARLNHDGYGTIDQYVDILMQEGMSILHRGQLGVICTNTHSSIVHLGPEICNCNVVDCDYAVFIGDSIDHLQHEIIFHQRRLDSPYCSKEQQDFSQQRIEGCLARLAELQGYKVVEQKYPQLLKRTA